MADSELTAAFVLHSRPFKETSLIVELFTEDNGRVNVLAKGVRGNRKNPSFIATFSTDKSQLARAE